MVHEEKSEVCKETSKMGKEQMCGDFMKVKTLRTKLDSTLESSVSKLREKRVMSTSTPVDSEQQSLNEDPRKPCFNSSVT